MTASSSAPLGSFRISHSHIGVISLHPVHSPVAAVEVNSPVNDAMRKATRRSTAPAAAAEDVRSSVGSFSTRFSLSSFVKQVRKLSDPQRDAIKNTGFGSLLLLSNHMLSKNLLVELMERWSCDKCAFVFHSDEIGITLMDVALILGLPVIGDPVVLKEDEPFSDLEEEFGAALLKRKVSIASLESKLDSFGGAVSDDFTRTFILFIIGTVLFPNTSGKVDSRYLSFLNNLDNVCNFAWGAAVLEDIITWLHRRKEADVQYIGGCLIFLQIWSYEHIDIARPGLLDTYGTFPRARRWENSRSHQRQWFSSKFKELQPDQITRDLQLTSYELELSIVKELLNAQNNGKEHTSTECSSPKTSAPNVAELSIVKVLLDAQNDEKDSTRVDCSSTKASAPKGAEVGVDTNLDVGSEAEAEQMSLDQLQVSTSGSEVHTKKAKAASTLQDAYIDSTSANWADHDWRTRCQMLDLQNKELKEENDKLQTENTLLRRKHSSIPLLEQQIVNLKKELEDLRREKEITSLSTNRLVLQLENILLDE